MKVLLVDDEALARDRLRRLLEGHPEITIVGEASDGRQALLAIARLAPDLVFLDIDMPVLSGLEVAESLGDRGPRIVFVTAYAEHAIRAFETAALDYLVKPVRAERLAKAVERASREHAPLPTALLAASLGVKPRLALKSGADYVVVDPARITAITAVDHYASVHVEGGEEILCDDSLDTLQSRLNGSRFLRLHRSAIANVEHVSGLEREGDRKFAALMRDGTRLPISRERLDSVRAALGIPS